MRGELAFTSHGARYRLARRAGLDADERERAVTGHALRQLVRRLLEDEGPWANWTLMRLCDELGVASPARWRSRNPSASLELALARWGGPWVLLREPPIRVGGHTKDELEVEEWEPREEDTAWIEIQLVDEEDKPVAGVAYEIKLSDGRVRRGVTNANGVVRYDRIPGGACEFMFPQLDREAWECA